MANPLIIDGRNLLDPAEARAAGFVYEGIGRPVAADAFASADASAMEAIILAAARPSGSATRPAAGRSRSSRSPGKPLAAYQVGAPRAGRRRARDHLLRRRPGRALRARARGPRRRRSSPPRSRSGSAAAAGSSSPRAQRRESGDVFALNGDELVAVDFAALLARHREAGGAATVAVARPHSPFGVVELGDGDVVEGFSEGGRDPYWVNCGIYVLSRGGDRALPGAGRPRDDDVPGARRRGPPARLPPRGALADGEHAEGAPHRSRARRGAPGVARVSGAAHERRSPNIALDRGRSSRAGSRSRGATS